MKRIAESVNANSEAISGVDGRVEGLEVKVAELIGIVSTLLSTIEQDLETLNGKMVEADIENPVSLRARFGREIARRAGIGGDGRQGR